MGERETGIQHISFTELGCTCNSACFTRVSNSSWLSCLTTDTDRCALRGRFVNGVRGEVSSPPADACDGAADANSSSADASVSSSSLRGTGDGTTRSITATSLTSSTDVADAEAECLLTVDDENTCVGGVSRFDFDPASGVLVGSSCAPPEYSASRSGYRSSRSGEVESMYIQIGVIPFNTGESGAGGDGRAAPRTGTGEACGELGLGFALTSVTSEA